MHLETTALDLAGVVAGSRVWFAFIELVRGVTEAGLVGVASSPAISLPSLTLWLIVMVGE